MKWNWQQSDWKQFSYNKALLEPFEDAFLKGSGYLLGVYDHLQLDDQIDIKIEILTTEALKTSEIEGEYLDRDSVQASLRRSFGLETDQRKIPASEFGIAQVMMDLYQNHQAPISHEKLFEWHSLLLNGRQDIQVVGDYRQHADPMRIVSGRIYDPKVHFEAPPSEIVSDEMEAFVDWYNNTAPSGDSPLSPIIRTGIAHFYFLAIHPFEDGNGRIGRALAEKALSQHFENPALLSLSYTIEKNKKHYYQQLEKTNQSNELTEWLLYFAQLVLDAQDNTKKRLVFLVGKTKLYQRLQGQLNSRQEKVLHRLFVEGIDGFVGGLSAKNYMALTKTSTATATRDLQDLVAKDVFCTEGKLKSTRYYLNV